MKVKIQCCIFIILTIIINLYYNYFIISIDSHYKNRDVDFISKNEYHYYNRKRSDSKSVIIGMLAKYKWNIVKLFFHTLNKSGYINEIICFILDESDSIYNIHYKEYNIIPVYFSLKYPYLLKNNTHYPISESLINQIPIITLDFFFYANLRFFLLNIFLQTYSNKFSYILTTDIRDMIFQSNPFHWNYDKGIYLSHETQHCVYKDAMKCNKYNYMWISHFKPSSYILNQTFINAGQIFGSSNEMKEFMKEYVDFMIKYHFKDRIKEWTCDQGMLNVFVYSKNNLKYPIIIFKAEYGYVRILGLDLNMNRNDYEPDDDLLIRNIDGNIPCMIHQYESGLKYGSRKRREKFKNYLAKLNE